MSTKGTQVIGKSAMAESRKVKCSYLCNKVPTNVPMPGPAQRKLHPDKDVFLLKVAKVGANGRRQSKLELELVSPLGPSKHFAGRLETREAQCEPPCNCCCPKVCCCKADNKYLYQRTTGVAGHH